MILKTIKELHIELTSRCTLACPRCPRTIHEGEYTIDDLNLNVLKDIIYSEGCKELEMVYLCGNHGDPIYHPKFHKALEILKERGLRIEIDTNGSHRKAPWWQKVADILDENDIVNFSVDGVEQTNHKYRVNARWSSIEKAMRIMATSKATINWKWIIFKYNETQMDEGVDLAVEFGLDNIIFVKSGLFGEQYFNDNGVDPLEPSEGNRIFFPAHEDKKTIYPRCKKQPRPFVSAQGIYMPCCWVGNAWAYNGGYFQQHESELDLKIHDIGDVVGGKCTDALEKLEESWPYEWAPQECKILCGRSEPPPGWDEDTYRSSYERTTINLKE